MPILSCLKCRRSNKKLAGSDLADTLIFQKNSNGVSIPPPGYKLATVAQCQNNLDACKKATDGDGAWAICSLADGKVSGSGYGYGIQTGSFPNQGCAIITPAPSCPNGLPVVGSGQQCGPSKGCCPGNECCSQYGWCSGGSTGAAGAPWCGAGCQKGYGKCGSPAPLIYQKNPNGISAAPPGYKLATMAQCQNELDACKAAVDGDGPWAICTLADGKVSGSGYGYSIQAGSYPNQGCAVITPN